MSHIRFGTPRPAAQKKQPVRQKSLTTEFARQAGLLIVGCTIIGSVFYGLQEIGSAAVNNFFSRIENSIHLKR